MGAVADFLDDPWGTITDGVEKGWEQFTDLFDMDEWMHDPLGQLVEVVGVASAPATFGHSLLAREAYDEIKEGAEDLAHSLRYGGKDAESGGVTAAKSPAADTVGDVLPKDKGSEEGGEVVPEVETKGNVGGEGSGNNGAGGNRAAALVRSGLVSQGAGTFGFTEPDDASKKAAQKLGA